MSDAIWNEEERTFECPCGAQYPTKATTERHIERCRWIADSTPRARLLAEVAAEMERQDKAGVGRVYCPGSRKKALDFLAYHLRCVEDADVNNEWDEHDAARGGEGR